VALLLQQEKGVRYVLQLQQCGRLPRAVVIIDVVFAHLFHPSVVKGPRQNAALAFDCPIANGLINQQMEKRVIGSRHGTPKTGLCRILALSPGKMIRLL